MSNHIKVIRECINQRRGLTINYPPDYDGCLHVFAEKIEDLSKNNPSFIITFEHAAKQDSSAWDILVEAAKAVLAQNERMLNSARQK